MKPNASRILLVAGAFFLIAFGSTSTYAALFTFSQGGFENGGIVTGSFEAFDIAGAFDKNGKYSPDGKIHICTGRYCPFPDQNDSITKLSFHFSGNPEFEELNNVSGVGLTGISIDLKDISRSELHLGTCDTTCFPFLQYFGHKGGGGIQGVGIYPNDYEYGGFHFDTKEPLLFAPLPGSLGLFIMGLAWLEAIRRKVFA
ncbi:hypothetical protein MCAMS1_02322 [biofilm metagenome]